MLKMLTDVEIRRAKSTEKPLKLFDGGGLFLLLKLNGSRLWRMKYRVAGREKLLPFGAYPEIALKDAREQRDEARRLPARGSILASYAPPNGPSSTSTAPNGVSQPVV